MFGAFRNWLDERRRARQRKALLAKQAKKAEKAAPVVAAAKKPVDPVSTRAVEIEEEERPR